MIGFLGGTGPEGRGLALRLALAGEDVIIGSRDGSRAAAAAEEVAGLAPGAVVEGALNEETAARADVVFIAVPYSAQRPTIEPLAGHLAGKVVVGVTVPVRFSKGAASIQPVPNGSAALEIQALLPKSMVVAAFQTISAHDLLDPNKRVDSDVVVCSIQTFPSIRGQTGANYDILKPVTDRMANDHSLEFEQLLKRLCGETSLRGAHDLTGLS